MERLYRRLRLKIKYRKRRCPLWALRLYGRLTRKRIPLGDTLPVHFYCQHQYNVCSNRQEDDSLCNPFYGGE